MKHLLLIRHAKAAAGSPDKERPLTSEGEGEARKIGERLSVHNLAAAAILSSPAKRCMQTVALLGRELGFAREDVLQKAEMYEANVGDLLRVLQGIDDGFSAGLLVGHNPGLSELGEFLSQEVFGSLPTCGVLVLEFDVLTWKDIGRWSGKLLWSDNP